MDQNQNSNQEIGNNNNNNSNGGAKLSTSSYLCRQSSTRWTPTTEQIKLLKELYYINGVRSPNADEIQSICARLRRYGKIEGKNVFYWFQNHKARERQKKRLTPNTTTTTAPTNGLIRNGGLHWKQDHDFTLQSKYSNLNTLPAGVGCSSSSGGAQMMGSFGYGAVTMENKFRDCSISGGNGGNVNHNFQWATATGNYNPYAPPPPPPHYSHILDKIDSDQDGAPEIETLPLFPMHNENYDHDHGFYTIKPEGSDGYYRGGYRWSNGGSNASASLELSLNSYGYGSCYSPNV